MTTYSADLIADYFLTMADPDVGDGLSNLKLQKLCYYAAGVIAAVRQDDSDPLFAEPIEAWTHGPVVPAQYRRFKEYGSDVIPPAAGVDFDRIETRDRRVLDDVFNVYGQFSAWKLRNMTHEETPWINSYNRADKSISTRELREYFMNEVDQEYIDSYRNYEDA